VLGNHQHSPGTSVLKEVNLLRIAEAFLEQNVRSSADLDEYVKLAHGDRPASPWWPRHPTFGRIAGVADQTWNYFLMLAGHTGVKVDRMICRYVARAVGAEPDDIAPKRAAQLVAEAAAELGADPHELDHAIWAFESGNVRTGL